MKDHELKIWPEFFDGIITGEKPFELRRNDRGYKQGDSLYLREYDPTKGVYSGRETRVLVTSMLEKVPGLQKGYCLMGIKSKAGELMKFNAKRAGKKS